MPDGKVNICSLEKDENLTDLVSLSMDFFREYESHHKDFFLIDKLNENDIADYFKRFIDAEERKAFIAIAEGQIIGYITVYVHDQPSFWQIKKVGDISGLMVHKDYRRQGIARQLLSKAVAFFTEKKVKYYTVFTSVNNNAGIEFYKQSGMEPLYTTMVGKIVNH